MSWPVAYDVIWIYDDCIRPPGPKMVVCIEPDLGFYFRINTKPNWQTPVKLSLHEHDDFLETDSYLECGVPLELDDYIIEESLRQRRGIIGRIAEHLGPQIFKIVETAKTITPADKAAIKAALRC